MVACHLCSRKEKSAFFRLMIRTGSCYQHSFSFPIHYQSFIGVFVILSRSYSPQTKPPTLHKPLTHSTHSPSQPNFQWISNPALHRRRHHRTLILHVCPCKSNLSPISSFYLHNRLLLFPSSLRMQLLQPLHRPIPPISLLQNQKVVHCFYWSANFYWLFC